ncbi:hypothetical protein ISCGN_000756 [Ixodes scapularis]
MLVLVHGFASQRFTHTVCVTPLSPSPMHTARWPLAFHPNVGDRVSEPRAEDQNLTRGQCPAATSWAKPGARQFPLCLPAAHLADPGQQSTPRSGQLAARFIIERT